MNTFIKQIEKACKNNYYYNIMKTMHIKDAYSNTKVAIVSIKENKDTERYYTIFYKYNSMHKIDNIGYYVSIYDENHKLEQNAYIDACKVFAKFSY